MGAEGIRRRPNRARPPAVIPVMKRLLLLTSLLLMLPAGAAHAGFQQQAQLTAADGGAADSLGVSVAVDGNTLVAASGRAVYVFQRTGPAWADATQVARLTPSDPADGTSGPVAIS